jgi:hypothetical protein
MGKIVAYDLIVAGLLCSCLIFLITCPRLYRKEYGQFVKIVICVYIFLIFTALITISGRFISNNSHKSGRNSHHVSSNL